MIPLDLKLRQYWLWSSDWMGGEVGLDCESVGLYSSPIEFYDGSNEDEATLNVYVDNETGSILQMWVTKEDED